MKLNPLKLGPTLITAGIAAFVCVVRILPIVTPEFKIFEELEFKTYDWRVRQAFNTNDLVSPVLGAVYIDDDDLKALNDNAGFRWPLPRQLYGKALRELKAQGAKMVGFDIMFAELDSPNPATDVVLTGGTKFSSDEYFAAELRHSSNGVLAVMGGELKNKGWQALPPHPLFQTNTPHLAHITSQADSDGVLRRALAFRDDPKLGRVWHLGIVLAAEHLGLDLNKAVVKPGKIILQGRNGLQRQISVDENNTFYIDWSLDWNDPRIRRESFVNVLLDEENRRNGTRVTSQWGGRLVVVGSIGSGNNISDMGSTPLSKQTYLVSKHWNVINSILTGQFVRRSSIIFDLACIWILGWISAFLTWQLRAFAAMIWVGLLMVAYLLLSVFLYNQSRIWIPIVLPVVGSLLLTHLCVVTYRVIFEQKERRRVRAVFSRIVSPDVVNELLGTEKLALGGARRKITVYFADVRGFTEMTDSVQARAEDYVREHQLTGEAAEKYFDQVAQEMLATVNLYLAAIADTVKKHDGTLDKYIGDCVMAFWGAPIENERHAVCCVLAAIDAQRAMYQLNQDRFAENKRREVENQARVAAGQTPMEMLPLLSLGSGINSGMAVVGLMGSEAHILNYTVFGREINLASRLEGVSGRGRIIIGETTYQELARFEPALAATCVEQAPIMVKGFKGPIKAFEVPWKETGSLVPPDSVQARPSQPVVGAS